MKRRHAWVLVFLTLACDTSDGDTDAASFDPTFEGEAAGDYIPTAGGSGATFTGGGNGGGTSGASTATNPTSPTNPTSVTTPGGSDSSSGGGGSSTCRMPCIDSTFCELGEACLATATMGTICLPVECDSCFADGGTCSSSTFDCSFDSCEIDPNATCNDPCVDASQCNVGQDCLQLTTGMTCVPVECSQCFAAQQGCSWTSGGCEFDGCDPA